MTCDFYPKLIALFGCQTDALNPLCEKWVILIDRKE